MRKTSTSVVRLLAGSFREGETGGVGQSYLVCFGKTLVHTYVCSKIFDFLERFKKCVMFAVSKVTRNEEI